MDILTKLNDFTEYDLDQNIFDRAVNFCLSLNPEILTDKQLEDLTGLINQIESAENIDEVKRAKKSLAVRKQYGKAYARKNRIRLKAKKKKIKNSAEGRKRARAKDRMAAAGKTPGGRRKVIYNTAKHINNG